jgi:hypothetical protein
MKKKVLKIEVGQDIKNALQKIQIPKILESIQVKGENLDKVESLVNKYKGIVQKEKGLDSNMKDFYYNYLCVKYGALTPQQLSKIDIDVIRQDYIDYVNQEIELFKKQLSEKRDNSKITIRQALTKAHKEKGRLSTEDLKDIQKQYPHFASLKNLQNTYAEIRDDIK